MKKQLTFPLMERPRVSFEERRAILRKHAPKFAEEMEIITETITHTSGKESVLEMVKIGNRIIGRVMPKI